MLEYGAPLLEVAFSHLTCFLVCPSYLQFVIVCDRITGGRLASPLSIAYFVIAVPILILSGPQSG